MTSQSPDIDNATQFGAAVASARKALGLTQRELALAINSGERFIVDLEAGKPTAQLGKATRQQRHFPITPTIEITGDEQGQRFVLEIVAADRTGLLARIAEVLSQRNVAIQTARINTLGARAEDIFVVSGGRLAEETTRIALETELAEAIA